MRRAPTDGERDPDPWVAQEPAGHREGGEHERERRPGRVEERRGGRRRAADELHRVLDQDEMGHGERPEHDGRDARVEVIALRRQPGQDGRLGGPGEDHDRALELDRHGHRQGGDAGAGDEKAERVAVALTHEAGHGQDPVGERDADEEEASPLRERAVQEHEATPHEVRGVGHEEGGRAVPQPVGRTEELLAAGGDGVDEPERREGDQTDLDRHVAEEPARQLGRRQYEGEAGEPAPRALEGHDRRRDEGRRDQREGHRPRRGTQERRRPEDGQEPERPHGPRIEPDRDDRGRHPEDQRPDEPELDRDEPVQPGRAHDRERPDAEPDADEDRRHDRLVRPGLEEPGPEPEHDHRPDEADRHPARRDRSSRG